MIYATKIHMKYWCSQSQHPEEIEKICLDGYGWHTKEYLHDYLKQYPKSIAVNISPYPYLIPAISSGREKYVRSSPDPHKHDDLMDLPRE